MASHPFTLALIAHDAKKDDIVRFAREHLDELRGLRLIATKTTGTLLESELGLDIETGERPRIVEGKIDGVIFFPDPLTSHPHEPDIQAVLKVCNIHDVPLATNRASALLLIRSLHDELRA